MEKKQRASSSRRHSDPGGTKRKLMEDEDEEMEGGQVTLGDAFSEIGSTAGQWQVNLENALPP